MNQDTHDALSTDQYIQRKCENMDERQKSVELDACSYTEACTS